MTEPSPRAEQSVGGFDSNGRLFVLALFGAAGAGLGALLPLLTGWAAELPWVPFQGPLELVSSFDQTWLVWGRPAIGLVAGLAFAAYVIASSPVLHIGAAEIRVQRNGKVERVIPRAKIDSIHRRGSKTVIASTSGSDLFADDVEGDVAVLREALLAAGYPWEGPQG